MNLVDWISVAYVFMAVIVAVIVAVAALSKNPNPGVSRREQRAIIKSLKSGPEDFVEVGEPVLETRSDSRIRYWRVRPSVRAVRRGRRA